MRETGLAIPNATYVECNGNPLLWIKVRLIIMHWESRDIDKSALRIASIWGNAAKALISDILFDTQ